MTITYGPHGRIVELTLDDTVGFHIPGEQATVRLLTTPRDTDAAPVTERISFGVVGSRPEPPIGVTRQRIYPTPPHDDLQERFDRFAAGGGRHRAPEPTDRPGLFARLFRRARRGGA